MDCLINALEILKVKWRAVLLNLHIFILTGLSGFIHIVYWYIRLRENAFKAAWQP